jgi:uncharacterized protein (DUF58 family)
MTWMERRRAIGAAIRSAFRFAPERRLALALAATAPLWLLPRGAGMVAGGGAVAVIIALALADAVMLPPATGFVVTRTAPGKVGIGDRTDGAYEVASRWPRAFHLRLTDRLPPAVQGGAGTVEFALTPFGGAGVPFTVTGMARGRAPLGIVGAHVRSRLGLVGERFVLPMADEVLVIPSVSGVRRYRLLAMQHRLDAIGVRALRRKGEGQGFAGLREYVLGDDPRHIDWKATARKAKVITREFTIERSQTVLTLIDSGRAMTQLAGRWSRFEQALSSALVLTDIAVSAGDRVGTLVFDDEIRAFVPAQQSRGALQAVRDALVPVLATTREPDYASAFRFLAVHQRKRALIVFFTDVIDVRASKALLAHVARGAARHLVVVVALRNDAIFAAAESHPGRTPLRLYETAAAEELVLAREEALERMRRAGVVVLDVAPSAMTAGVINRYLELKARGAL